MFAKSGWLHLLFLALFVGSPHPSALAQGTREHHAANIRGFHGLGARIVRSIEPDDEARNFFRQLLDAAGFPPIDDRILIRASEDTHNAEAFVERGQRYILYNSAFMREIAEHTGNYWSLVAVLAHELGHFKLRHIVKRMLTMLATSLIGFAVIGWLIAQPGVTAPIASATSLDQLEELVAALRLDLASEQIATLTAASD